jgi:hypothetical protein
MVYNTWNYWVFGFCPSPGILKNTEEHNVSETGSEDGNRFSFRNIVFFSVLRNTGQWTKYKTPVILRVLVNITVIHKILYILIHGSSILNLLPIHMSC